MSDNCFVLDPDKRSIPDSCAHKTLTKRIVNV